MRKILQINLTISPVPMEQSEVSDSVSQRVHSRAVSWLLMWSLTNTCLIYFYPFPVSVVKLGMVWKSQDLYNNVYRESQPTDCAENDTQDLSHSCKVINI